jgi:predicted O-methyltransferase YrrM
MTLVVPGIERYLNELCAIDDPMLREMERMAVEEKFPIIGPLVGRLCWVLASSVRARDVFEMGSGFGYSTYWFAHSVGEGGRVVYTDLDARRCDQARRQLVQAGLAGRMTFEVGDAREIITRYPGPFDLIFIDLEKEQYPEALELARVRVRPGGLIVADGALLCAQVAEPAGGRSAAAEAVAQYNRGAMRAADLVTTIVPVRDGVAISIKLDGVNPFRRRRSSQPPATGKR